MARTSNVTTSQKSTVSKSTAKRSKTAKETKSKGKVIDMKSKQEAETMGLNTEAIKALEGAGFKRWRKGGHDRLYISAGKLGLRIEDDIATFKGSPISIKEGERMKAARTYIDVLTGETYSGSEVLESEAEALVSNLLSIKNIEYVI